MDKDVARGVIVFFFGCLGVILAGLIELMNDYGYIIDEYITGSITLPELQIIVVILFLLAGVIVAVVS